MPLGDQARPSYFNANGKRANAIRARTTPGLEETKSENMQKLDLADQCGQDITGACSSNSDDEYMRWNIPITCRQSIDWIKYY